MAHENTKELQDWLDENVHNIPGLSDHREFDAEIDRLIEKLQRDYGGRFASLTEEFEVRDLIQEKLEQVLDRELGFKDHN